MIKFKTSDYIAFLALFMSAISLWQTYTSKKPNIMVATGYSGVGSISSQKDGYCVLVADFFVEINNSGATSAKLLRIKKTNGTPVLRFEKNNEIININKGKIVLLKKPVSAQYGWNLIEQNKVRFDFSKPSFINEILQPKTTKRMNFAILADIYRLNANLADRIYLTFEMINDGYLPIRSILKYLP